MKAGPDPPTMLITTRGKAWAFAHAAISDSFGRGVDRDLEQEQYRRIARDLAHKLLLDAMEGDRMTIEVIPNRHVTVEACILAPGDREQIWSALMLGRANCAAVLTSLIGSSTEHKDVVKFPEDDPMGYLTIEDV